MPLGAPTEPCGSIVVLICGVTIAVSEFVLRGQKPTALLRSRAGKPGLATSDTGTEVVSMSRAQICLPFGAPLDCWMITGGHDIWRLSVD